MSVSNPIEKPLEDCLQQLTTLNGVLHVIKSQGDMALARLKSYDSSRVQQRLLYASRLLLEDIGSIPDDLWRQFSSTGHDFVVRGEDVEQAFADILERMNLYIVSQAYETYETFLFDSVAYLHYSEPATRTDKKRLEKWDKKNSHPSSLEDWQNYARGTYRGKNNRELLCWIRCLASQVADIEKQNTLRMNLHDWFEAASEVRHAATHSSGLIKTENVGRLSRDAQAVLRNQFPGIDTADGYHLHLDTKSAREALQVFHNYAYAIHKSLSLKHGYVPAYASEISQ